MCLYIYNGRRLIYIQGPIKVNTTLKRTKNNKLHKMKTVDGAEKYYTRPTSSYVLQTSLKRKFR